MNYQKTILQKVPKDIGTYTTKTFLKLPLTGARTMEKGIPLSPESLPCLHLSILSFGV